VGHEVDRVKVRGLEQRGEVVRVIPHGVRPDLATAQPVAATVVGQHLQPAREPRSHRVPTVVIGPRTVDERGRVTRDPGPFVEDLSVGNLDCGHRSSETTPFPSRLPTRAPVRER